jgi:hypothetical protein
MLLSSCNGHPKSILLIQWTLLGGVIVISDKCTNLMSSGRALWPGIDIHNSELHVLHTSYSCSRGIQACIACISTFSEISFSPCYILPVFITFSAYWEIVLQSRAGKKTKQLHWCGEGKSKRYCYLAYWMCYY